MIQRLSITRPLAPPPSGAPAAQGPAALEAALVAARGVYEFCETTAHDRLSQLALTYTHLHSHTLALTQRRLVSHDGSQAKKLVGLIGSSNLDAQRRAAHALYELAAKHAGAASHIVRHLRSNLRP